MGEQRIDLAIPNFKLTTDVDETAEAWKKWAKLFTRKVRFFKIADAEDRLIALQIYGGDEIDELIETLEDPTDADVVRMPKEWGMIKLKANGSADEAVTTFHKAIYKVHKQLTTSSNKDAARSKFESMKQGDAPMAKYYVELKKQADKCQFAEIGDSIRTRILQTMTDKKLRREAMTKNYTLDQLLQHAYTKEDVERQASAMENEEKVNRVYEQRRRGGGNPRRGRGRGSQYRGSGQRGGMHDKPPDRDHKDRKNDRPPRDRHTDSGDKPRCSYCGFNHDAGRSNCPASGKECRKCHNRGPIGLKHGKLPTYLKT